MGKVNKRYEFTGFGAMDVTKPYKCIGFGAMPYTWLPSGSNLKNIFLIPAREPRDPKSRRDGAGKAGPGPPKIAPSSW